MDPPEKVNYGFIYDGKQEAVTEELEQFKVEEKKKKTKTKAKWTCCQITLLVLSIFTVIVAATLLIAFPAIFDAIFHSKLEVVPGSYSYELWRYTPVPIYIRFYIFNITNADEFIKGGKAVLEEVGPYVYREFHEKNMTFHDNNTVSYYQQRWWIWDQEASGNRSQDDKVVILNTVPVAAAWTVRKSPAMVWGLNKFLKAVDEQLIVTTSIRNVIFEGFEDPVLNFVHGSDNNGSFPSFLPPGLAPYDKFGWFYKRNLSFSYDGFFNMHNGHDTLDNLGTIDWWNGANNTDFFEPPCNAVEGSAGELWPPGIDDDQVSLFSPDLCMTLTLYFKEDTRDANGLPGYRFWGTNESLPGDGCYCVNDVCAPTGLLNAESCRMGAPAYVSFPHFLHANATLLDGVEGMAPDPDEHGFVLDIIPEVGVPMHVMARMQINMLVIPYKRIDILKKVTEVYLPLLWFEEEAAMPKSLAWQLKALLFIMNTPFINILFSVMLVLGVIGALCVCACHYRKSRRNKD